MRVKIEFETTDHEGEKQINSSNAVMEIFEANGMKGYRLVYLEDLSSDGNMTRSTMWISPQGLRISRKGPFTADFMYEKNMVHNTSYRTPYGSMPVSIETRHYEFAASGLPDVVGVFSKTTEAFLIAARVKYTLAMSDDKPMPMDVRIRITGQER